MLTEPHRSYYKDARGHAFIRMDGLGDLWLWLPFAATLKKRYTNTPFYLLVNAQWTSIAELASLFDKVVPLQTEKFHRFTLYRNWAIQEITKHIPPVEKVWQVTYSRRIVVEDLLSHAIPSQERIAWTRDPSIAEPPWLGKWVDARVYTTLYPSPLPPLTHEWIRYQEWLKQIGIDSLELDVYHHMHQKLQHDSSTPFIAAVIGAGSPTRLPPLSVTEKLLRLLYKRIGWPIYLIGTASDKKVAMALEAKGIKDYTGKLSLIEAVKMVANATMVIAPETGLGHIGSTVGVPTLIIAGGGHWGRFIPYPPQTPFTIKVISHEMPCFGCGWICKYQLSRSQPYPCISQLSPEAVAEEALKWAEHVLSLKTQSIQGSI